MSTQRERDMARVLRDLVQILDDIPESDRLRLGLYSIYAVNEAQRLAGEVESEVEPEEHARRLMRADLDKWNEGKAKL